MVVTLRRRMQRRTERGTAIFIVVMAIVLLTGIGIFAVRTASMVDVAAGYDRQAMQTHHLAELAGRIAASQTGGSEPVLREMIRNNRSGHEPFGHEDLENRVMKDTGNPLFVAPAATVAGSFGPPVATELVGRSPVPEGQIKFFLSDPNDKLAPEGEDVKNQGPIEVTVTAYGQIRPTSASGAVWCTTAESANAATVQAVRSHMTVIK